MLNYSCNNYFVLICAQENVENGILAKEFPLVSKELLSDTTIDTDDIEEGPLSELEEMQSFSGIHESPLSKPVWKEFVSDPGISVAEGGMNAGKFGRSYFSDDVQTRKQRDWTKLLSTSHLVEGEPSFKMTPPSLKTDEELKKHEVSPNSLVDTRQKVMRDIGGKSSIMPVNSSAAINLPQPSDVVARTSSIPESQTSGNLPVRPLTIGDSMTIGNSIGYRPVSPFTPDGNPPQAASSTSIISTLPSMSHVSEDAFESERDDPGDMSARERLQPLGRDGLEVKQGPPWGVTIPLFQPHSRKSSFSSNDSGSSHGSTSFFQPQSTSAPTTKPNVESSQPGGSDGPLSRRSSLRSVESKEPMAAKVFNPSESPNIPIGKFHPLKPFEGDVDSPVSKILGPTFKTTQKMLEELQRRPLGVFHDSVEQQQEEEDGTLKILTKENERLSHDEETAVERKEKSLVFTNQRSVRALPENKHADHSNRTSDLFEIDHETKSKFVNNSNQLPSTDLKTQPDFQEGSKVNSNFPKLSKNGDSQRLVGEDKERSLFSMTETPKTSRITDSTLGNSVAISENVHPSGHVINDITRGKSTEVGTTDVTGRESLSWENVLEMHSTSGEMSEFDRVASESISCSSALASRFREELRSVDLRNNQSDDEGILDDETISGDPRDTAESESTTNEDIYRPKDLAPLSNQRGPIGIYDIRMSSGPGSTNRKRLALGKLPREITQPSLHGGVYVSEGATGTEVEDRGVESEPEGQSTPKSDDVTRIGSNDDDEMVDLKSVLPKFAVFKDGNISKKSSNFMNVRPSATVEHTWSISKPVMSQLDTKRTPVVQSGARQEFKQRSRDEQQSVHSSEKGRKRTSRHRKHSKKSPKSVKEHSNFSESSEYSPPDTSKETKKSLADIILENFRREEKEQQKRLKKLEELKRNKPAPDLNALWDRFQEFVSKNYKDTQKKNSRTLRSTASTSSQRTPFSDLSVASSSDIPFTEDKSPDQTVNLSTDSNEEFEKFLRRVRQVQSSDTGSVVSRGSSDRRPRRQHEHWSTPIPRVHQKPHTKVSVLSSTDQITSTSEEPCEPEPTLSLPMWLGFNTKHPKKKQKGTSAPKIKSKYGSTICTCGGRDNKITSTKVSAAVRDVGVNCPTPPVISREMNTVDVAALKIKTLEERRSNEAAPPSLVKLTLQDAFMYSKQDFVKRSRERIRNMKEKREEESADVVVIPSDKKKSKREKVKEDDANTGISKPLKLYGEWTKFKGPEISLLHMKVITLIKAKSNVFL